jgi:hypothetical protein
MLEPKSKLLEIDEPGEMSDVACSVCITSYLAFGGFK